MPPGAPPPTWTPPTGGAYGAPGGYTAYGPTTHSKAVPALVIGIISIVLACCCSPLGVVGGIVAAVLGNQAKGEIAASGGRLGGESQAQAGFVIGIVAIALGTVLFILGLVTEVVDWSYNFETG